MAKFTASEDEQLVELVAGHPLLWNLADMEFKNTMKKDLIWQEIGLLINKSGSECKTRWRSIKDHRQRQKKQDAKVGTGSAATKRKASYWNRLNFLDTVEEERSTFSNAVVEESQNSLRNDDLDTPPDEVNRKPSPVNSTGEKSISEECGPSLKKREKKVGKTNKELVDFLKNREEQRSENRKLVQQVLSQGEEDDIDLFFKAMAATVKKFSDENKVETKMKIFSVVNEIEMRNFRPTFTNRFDTLTYQENTTSTSPSSNSYTNSVATTTPLPSPTVSSAEPNEHFQSSENQLSNVSFIPGSFLYH